MHGKFIFAEKKYLFTHYLPGKTKKYKTGLA